MDFNCSILPLSNKNPTQNRYESQEEACPLAVLSLELVPESAKSPLGPARKSIETRQSEERHRCCPALRLASSRAGGKSGVLRRAATCRRGSAAAPVGGQLAALEVGRVAGVGLDAKFRVLLIG